MDKIEEAVLKQIKKENTKEKGILCKWSSKEPIDNFIYFDCEFTGLHKNATLISIGFITVDGKSFYAEFTDYDESQVNDWVRENVIEKLRLTEVGSNTRNGFDTKNWEVKGDKIYINSMLMLWLGWIKMSLPDDDTKIQFVSDVCHYDFVFLVDLLTMGHTAMELPKFISPTCIDINQEIGYAISLGEQKLTGFWASIHSDNYTHDNSSATRAFDMNREEFIENISDKEYDDKDKHNSLFDATIIRDIHTSLWGIV